MTVYALAFGGLLLLGGRIADLIKRPRALTYGLVGFATGSLLGAVVPDATTLLLARGLQGASAAFLAPAALSLLAVTFPEPVQDASACGDPGRGSLGSGSGLPW